MEAKSAFLHVDRDLQPPKRGLWHIEMMGGRRVMRALMVLGVSLARAEMTFKLTRGS